MARWWLVVAVVAGCAGRQAEPEEPVAPYVAPAQDACHESYEARARGDYLSYALGSQRWKALADRYEPDCHRLCDRESGVTGAGCNELALLRAGELNDWASAQDLFCGRGLDRAVCDDVEAYFAHEHDVEPDEMPPFNDERPVAHVGFDSISSTSSVPVDLPPGEALDHVLASADSTITGDGYHIVDTHDSTVGGDGVSFELDIGATGAVQVIVANQSFDGQADSFGATTQMEELATGVSNTTTRRLYLAGDIDHYKATVQLGGFSESGRLVCRTYKK